MATAPRESFSGPPPLTSRLEIFESFAALGSAQIDTIAFTAANYRPRLAPVPRTLADVMLSKDKREQYQETASALFQTAVALVLHAAPDDAKAYVQQSLRAEIDVRPETTQVIEGVFKSIPKTVTEARNFRSLADNIIPGFEREAAEDPTKSFIITQVMAADPHEVHVKGTRGEQEELLALLWTGYAANHGRPEPHQASQNQLKDSVHNERIASEVLTEIVTEPREQAFAQHPSAMELKRFVAKLMEAFNMEESKAVAGMATTAGFSLWPPDAFQVVIERRTEYLQRLERAAELRRDFLKNHSIILPHTNLNKFRQHVHELDMLVPGHKPANKRLTKAGEVAARVKARAAGDNRFQPVASATANGKNTLKTASLPEKAVMEQRDLRYINGQGSQQEEGSPAFERVKSDYLKKHDGDGKREADVASGLDFLRNLALASGPNGQTPGIRQLEGQRINYSTTGKKLPVFELKPKEAGKEAPTSSEGGDKLRMDFVILPDRAIGLLAIYNRSLMKRGRHTNYNHLTITEHTQVPV